ncbi:unnamed protein product, partial [marine sediment metagenome]
YIGQLLYISNYFKHRSDNQTQEPSKIEHQKSFTDSINFEPITSFSSKAIDIAEAIEHYEEKLNYKKTIYLSPDGVYNKININALYTPSDDYYIKKKNLIYLNSLLELIVKIPKINTQNNKALLFGDPNFSLDSIKYNIFSKKLSEDADLNEYSKRDFRNIYLADLPYTRQEIKTIGSILNQHNWDTLIFLGDYAIEENFKNADNPRLIHIATHGYFAENLTRDDTDQKLYLGMNWNNVFKNPMLRSGLLLAGCQTTINGEYKLTSGYEDGILSANEIMNMDLTKNELVVLSACNSGRGEIRPGEGVFGLQRAFKIAGARSILLSLWPVEDKSTKLLMEYFYRLWLSGMNKREALKAAQLKLMQDPFYNHPLYWGAFILVGDN